MQLSTACLVLLAVYLSATTSRAADGPPLMAEGFVADVVAKEPLVRNPCVMAFDRLGRLCVAHGPQWRNPKPHTPGDHIDILIDDDDDGIADRSQRFAEGFNSVQAIAWHGDDLWVANSPDLTVVRDTDGDDEADVYFRVYTGLGNLEHSLHGLNFGPDGKLYMSKGNSKGYNRLDQLAPKAFRDLWGLPSPEGAPDYTPIEAFTKESYRRKYHTFRDDWGQQGGVLRCDPYDSGQLSARNLEIICRGMRNPWDIAFDDAFNWLATDNDQTDGDRILSPFVGANFGWGHPWSFSWTGNDHLPTVPVSAPLFEGSGTGVIHYHAGQFPEAYQNVFLVADWLQRRVTAYRPRLQGGLIAAEPFPSPLAAAGSGRTMPESAGRAFDPTDIEVGPDGALYVLSWGHSYGGTLDDGQQQDIGRVYRIRYANRPLLQPSIDHRRLPFPQWSLEQLFADLGSDLPAWRVNAQQELMRRGPDAQRFLRDRLGDPTALTRSQQTWAAWTLSKLGDASELLNLASEPNVDVQVCRAIASRIRNDSIAPPDAYLDRLTSWLRSDQPRTRFEATQAIVEARLRPLTAAVIEAMGRERDRVTFYAMWNGLRNLIAPDERRRMLQQHAADPQDGRTRLGLLLGLLADAAVSVDNVRALRDDSDPHVANIANRWLEKTGAEQPLIRVSPPPGDYVGHVEVSLEPRDPAHRLTFTTDGSVPAATSPRYNGPIRLDESATLQIAAIKDNTPAGKIVTAKYNLVEDLKLMTAQSKPVTIDQVLEALDSADPELGGQLFSHSSGAGCTKCHSMKREDVLLAPDLSDLGNRAKTARVVVESILDPSKIITEGFAQQKLLTVDGRVFTGAIIEETGRVLKIVGTDGVLKTIEKSGIEERSGTHTSPMPTGFQSMMSAHQLASLTAWLMLQKSGDDKTATNGFRFDDRDDALHISLDGQRVATYLKSHPILTRPALVNVQTHRGTPVTRTFRPERITADKNRERLKSGTDHPVMHPGIWISFGNAGGNDFWRLKAKCVFQSFTKPPQSDGKSLQFETQVHMLPEGGGRPVCTETTNYTFRRGPAGIQIEISVTYQPTDGDFYFGDQEESGLGVRVAPELRVRDGSGTIINDRGQKNERQLWGKEAKWFDYAGLVDGRHIGIMVVSSPDNPRPSWLHARDYGVVVTNPFPKQPRERKQPFVKTWVRKGESLRLAYVVLIHDSPNDESFDHQAAYNAAVEAMSQ